MRITHSEGTRADPARRYGVGEALSVGSKSHCVRSCDGERGDDSRMMSSTMLIEFHSSRQQIEEGSVPIASSPSTIAMTRKVAACVSASGVGVPFACARDLPRDAR